VFLKIRVLRGENGPVALVYGTTGPDGPRWPTLFEEIGVRDHKVKVGLPDLALLSIPISSRSRNGPWKGRIDAVTT
jgi:hypothetical protein